MALAKASEQFRQSDVTSWGIVALVLGAIAVLGANVSAVLPQGMLSGLHKTRIEGASLEQVRSQVTELREETQRLKRDNSVLTARFALGEQQSGDMVRRVGALEVSLPRLLENAPVNSAIDRSTITGSIGDDPALVYDADGGSVVVRHQPMAEALPAIAMPQPLPASIDEIATAPAPSTMPYGIALGVPVSADQAADAWRDLSVKLGPLLFGLEPRLADQSESDDKRLVVGPMTQLAEASALCARLERISVSCLPVPYAGTPLNY